MTDLPQQALTPELIFGLIAPIGTDLDVVADALEAALSELSYNAKTLKLTDVMRDVGLSGKLTARNYIESYTQRISYANRIRERFGNTAMAALAISAIRSDRAEVNSLGLRGVKRARLRGDPAEEPVPSQAYIVRQLKRPEEVRLLRQVYGRQFILVSAYAPRAWRLRRIEDKERESRAGLVDAAAVHSQAYKLIAQDSKESQEEHGQNVSDAFPMGDVFIDASSPPECNVQVRRFIQLLFGNNQLTPTHDEYSMYIAKSASLRSSDLSRQVGAATFSPTGEILSLGCNEVPRARGGTYWEGDQSDGRDFVLGYDPNERIKGEVLVDVIDRLKSEGHLSQPLLQLRDVNDVVERLLSSEGVRSVRDSKIMDLIEFGRIIHAEMSAISDAARRGTALADSTLYCTTFPCHLCAKHIVAAGIRRVVYLEPYPKSYASDLHSDSIRIDDASAHDKVSFEAFIGVSPFRYRDLIEKGKRKYAGQAQKWDRGKAHPLIEVFYPSYFAAELHVVGSFYEKLERRQRRSRRPQVAPKKGGPRRKRLGTHPLA